MAFVAVYYPGCNKDTTGIRVLGRFSSQQTLHTYMQLNYGENIHMLENDDDFIAFNELNISYESDGIIISYIGVPATSTIATCHSATIVGLELNPIPATNKEIEDAFYVL